MLTHLMLYNLDKKTKNAVLKLVQKEKTSEYDSHRQINNIYNNVVFSRTDDYAEYEIIPSSLVYTNIISVLAKKYHEAEKFAKAERELNTLKSSLKTIKTALTTE